jgi:hypothetical protein
LAFSDEALPQLRQTRSLPLTLTGSALATPGLVGLTVALFCLMTGLALAWQHPLWPTVSLALFYIWVVVVAWRPWLWLFFVPACLPFLNFWPWTGWQAFDEFDLLLLGALAGGYARGLRLARNNGRAFNSLLLALTLATAISLARGLISAGWFDNAVDTSLAASQAQTYESVWNVFRIAKSLAFALLFAPLLASQMQTEASRQRAQRLFGTGMLVGLAVVTLVALWERAAYPGWLEFSTRYRTTALFWEMHVGGAAIDAYLVIATPFLGWALWSTRRPALWAGLALLAVLTCYAVLTTFSRGVYLAVLGPLVGMALSALVRKRRLSLVGITTQMGARISGLGWRGKAGGVLILLLATEVLGVALGGSFVAERVASAQDDLDSRIEHWSRGIDLLQTPLDWAFGLGLGRLPAQYAQISPETEFSGRVLLTRPAEGETPVADATRKTDSPAATPAASAYQITLLGPESNLELGGLFSLTQQVDFSKNSAYTAKLRARAETEADLRLKICEKHLIYEANCHYRFLKIRPLPDGQWQTLSIPLRGRSQSPNTNTLPRLGVFSMSVINAGGALAVQKVTVTGPGGKEILQNGDFSQGLSGWFPSSQSYYLPWHIDNVYLELLIERGLLGLALMIAWVLVVLKGAAQSPAGSQSLSRYLTAALVGAAMIGLVSSWMDAPRIAFMVFMLLFFSTQMNRHLPRDLHHNEDTR